MTESLSAYCFGRVLAARFGYEFAFPQLRNLVRDWKAGGTQFIGTEVAWCGQWPIEVSSGRKLCGEELRTDPQARLRLAGGFHRFELFEGERERIRGEWLVPAHDVPKRTEGELAVALATPNAGEPLGNCLSEDEVRRLARTVPHSDLVLISDREDHPLFAALADLSPTILLCAGWSQLMLLRSFQKIAISQDATQWWGAFLSDAAEIYFPPLDRGPWSHPEPAHLAHDPWWHGIDLNVPDEPRYIHDW